MFVKTKINRASKQAGPCSRIMAAHASFCLQLFHDILGLYVNATQKFKSSTVQGGSDIVHLIVNDTVFTVNGPKLDRIFFHCHQPGRHTVSSPSSAGQLYPNGSPLHRTEISRSSPSFCFSYSMLSWLCM